MKQRLTGLAARLAIAAALAYPMAGCSPPGPGPTWTSTTTFLGTESTRFTGIQVAGGWTSVLVDGAGGAELRMFRDTVGSLTNAQPLQVLGLPAGSQLLDMMKGALVVSLGDTGPTVESYRVYAYDESTALWNRIREISRPVRFAGSRAAALGGDVANSTGFLALGIPSEAGSGSVLVFDLATGELAEALGDSSVSGDFGHDLDADGSLLAVSDGPVARVFAKQRGTWGEVASAPSGQGRGPVQVAIDGDPGESRLAVASSGAPAENAPGSVSLFTILQGAATPEAVLAASVDANLSSSFGNDVALDGDTVVVAELGYLVDGRGDSRGQVYRRRNGVWQFERELSAAPTPRRGVSDFGTVATSPFPTDRQFPYGSLVVSDGIIAYTGTELVTNAGGFSTFLGNAFWLRRIAGEASGR